MEQKDIEKALWHMWQVLDRLPSFVWADLSEEERYKISVHMDKAGDLIPTFPNFNHNAMSDEDAY